MKHNSDCIRRTVCTTLCVLFWMLSWPVFAQQEDDKRIGVDSVQMKMHVQQETSFSSVSPVEEVLSVEGTAVPTPTASIPLSLEKPFVPPYYTNPSPLFHGDFSTGGILYALPRRAFYGAGSQTTLPGIGVMNDALLGYTHRLNDALTFQIDLSATKMNMPFAVGQTFGTSGSLRYQVSDRVAFRVFGGYAVGHAYGLKSSHYGATMQVSMSDRFSMEMGVQRYYNSMSGRWETVPVVIPSYRFNKATIGMDVGGLLYQLLHKVAFGREGMRMGNPTIGPPR